MIRPRRPRWPDITYSPCADDSGPRVLGINPWVYDFAAYNLWSRPAGLLVCLDMLARCGARTALLDLMDRTWQDQPWPQPTHTGTGRYPRTKLPSPGVLADVPRRYSRYGLDRERAAAALARISPPPDLILITSTMTYWYPGIVSVLNLVRRIWPGVPVCLGGIYVTLCPEHAITLDADLLISGPLEDPENWRAVWGLLGSSVPDIPEGGGLELDSSLYPAPEYSIILGSRGCPFGCSYCASHKLYPGFKQADPDTVFEHIQREYSRGVRDFAFYDDALLYRSEFMIIPLLEKILSRGLQLRLHTPNALHIRYLSRELCSLLYRAGLYTVRLGLETNVFGSRLDNKLERIEWEECMRNLARAGFDPGNIAAYILFGLPGQDYQALEETIKEVHAWGIRPELAHYSPIPGTKLFEQAKAHAWLDLEDPLAHNSSVWPCVPGGFSWEKRDKWRRIISGY